MPTTPSIPLTRVLRDAGHRLLSFSSASAVPPDLVTTIHKSRRLTLAADDGGSIAGAGSFSYTAATGVLQVTDTAKQTPSLSFQTSTLGSGSFNLSSDGGSGLVITHS